MNRRIGNWLKMALYRALAPIRDRWQPLLVENILEKNFGKGSRFVFVQVGAHDGISYDSLFEFVRNRKPAGIVIEPLPDLYDKLKANYSPFPEVIAVNSAVHATEKKLLLHRVDPAQQAALPEWSSGISSIFAEHHKRSGIPSSAIIMQPVTAQHLMTILEDNPVNGAYDYLQIDVEGFDYEVLKQVDFSRLHPLLIKFEYISLSASDAKAAISLLKKQGYWTFHQGMDIIAIDPDKITL